MESSAWGYRAAAVDGKDSGRGAWWGEARWDLAVAAGDGATPAYDVAGGGAWADGMTAGHGVEAAGQEDHASSPEIKEKEDHEVNKRQNETFLPHRMQLMYMIAVKWGKEKKYLHHIHLYTQTNTSSDL